MCTFENASGDRECGMCNTAKGAAPPAPVAAPASRPPPAAPEQLPQCGLFVACGPGAAEPVPLASVSVATSITDFIANVTLVQTFTNGGAGAVEAVYRFPLDERAAVRRAAVSCVNGAPRVTVRARARRRLLD